jgi:hypothetical protein
VVGRASGVETPGGKKRLARLRRRREGGTQLRFNVRRARNQLRKKGLSREEIKAWMTLHQRAAFARAHLHDRSGGPWLVRPYQEESLESYARRKVHCDGRDVGKTTEIELIAAWASVACPNREMLIAAQCENHLYPLMDRLVRRFEGEPKLAPCLAEVKRTPSWHFRFSNGFVLWGRIAGPRGVNFQGMHVDWQVVDEAQEMTETAWAELYQALNGGGRRWVYGVPNGLRNTFYRMSAMREAEQYNWPSSLNPDFTDEKDAELAQLYGGRDAPGYIHRVLGLHGAPAHGVFRLDDYLECVDDALDFLDVALCEEDRFEPAAPAPGIYYLGCDLGYARDPSEYVVYRNDGVHLVNVLRLHLRGVNYWRQQELIAALDAAYGFRMIAVDAGNNGRAVAHGLLALGAEWDKRVLAVEFGSVEQVGVLPDGSPDRRPLKQFMTDLIARRMSERTIVFPRLAERETQYANHTYRVGASGGIVYEKGNDHLIDADRCALWGQYCDVHREQPAPAPPPPRLEPF